MNSMALNSSYDVFVSDGKIARVTDSNAILQLVKTRLLTVKEEWFMDLDAGLPWFTQLTGRNVDLYKIRSYVAVSIINTPGVTGLGAVELELSKSDRKLNIDFTYTDKYGKTSSGSL